MQVIQLAKSVSPDLILPFKRNGQDFSGDSVVKNPSASGGNPRELGSIPGLERSPRGGNGNPLQYSCLENSMDRGAWWAIIHGVTKGSGTTDHTHTRIYKAESLCCAPKTNTL